MVATDEGKGGTWSGGTEALDHKFGRVAVWRGPGEGSGNEALARRGAAPIYDLDGIERLLYDDNADMTPHSSPVNSRNEQRTLCDIATGV